MAKEEEVPAFIDYSESAEKKENKPSKYWAASLVARHKTSTPPWSIKNASLWKRMDKEFGQDLTLMIDKWMETSQEPHNFASFYASRHKLHEKIIGKDYGWD